MSNSTIWPNNETIGGIPRKKYMTVHAWLHKNFYKPQKCEHCETMNAKRFEYALKKGCCYEKKRENYLVLCTSCHKIYDGHLQIFKYRTQEHFDKVGEGHRKKVVKCQKDGAELKIYECITDAWIETGILRSSISNVLNGRTFTAGGFGWKYFNESNKKVV